MVTTTTLPIDPGMSGGAPGDVYDPSKPYRAPDNSSPNSGGPPSITPPPTNPLAQQDAPKAPSVLPGSKGATAAGIAYGLDAVLRGAMKGREFAQQQKAAKLNKLMSGFGYAYKSASDQYLGMLQNDPDLAKKLGELNTITSSKQPTPEQQARAKELSSDPSVVKAQSVASAADSAWQAQQQIYNNYLNPDAGKKSKSKSSSSKSKGGDQSGQAGGGENPIQLLQSHDPNGKLRGYLMIRSKVGPGYKREAAYYMSPDYQKSRQLATGEQRIEGDVQAKRIELHDLQNADPSTLDDKKKQRLEQLRTDPELFPQIGRTVPHYGTSDIPGGSLSTAKDPYGNPVRDKFGNAIDPKQNYRIETIDGVQSYVPSAAKITVAKPGSEQEYVERIAKESGIDEKDLSADSLKAIRQSWAASGQMGKVVSRNYVYTDKETGQIVVVPLTSTTTPMGEGKGVPQVHASGTAAPSSTSGGHHPSTGGSAAINPAGTTATSDQLPAGSPKGAHVIGQTLSQPKAKAQATTTDTYKKMKPLFGLLSAQEDYMKEIEKDPSKATPRQDLSLVVAAVRSMNPGSVRLPQKELELEVKAGSFGDRLKRAFDNASTGLLPDDQRKDLYGIVQRETTKAGESLAADWSQNMSGQPLPTDLKRFDKGGSGGTEGNKGGGGGPALTPEQEKLLEKHFPTN